MTEPTDAELLALIEKHLGFKPRRDDTVIDPRTGRFHDVQRYRDMKADILAKWGTPPAVAGEAAEHYRNAIASACEGWTMPDGLRKHLETALWSPPTQAAPPAGREPLTEEQRSDIATAAAGFNWADDYVEAIDYVIDGVESLHGIKGGLHGAK